MVLVQSDASSQQVGNGPQRCVCVPTSMQLLACALTVEVLCRVLVTSARADMSVPASPKCWGVLQGW